GKERGREDGKKRRTDFPLLFALPLAILDPDRGLLHKITDVDAENGGQNAEPEKTAPSDRVEEQPIGGAGERKAEGERTLQDAPHQAARARRPRLHGETCAGRPFRAHADTERGPNNEQGGEVRRKTGNEIADGEPQNRKHQRRFPADAVAEPARSDGPNETQPKGERDDCSDRGYRDAEFLGDRRHDEQEDGEVEAVEHPPEARRDP